ncbi:MAG: macro domain-containing protein [Thermoleophilia bacterium]
MSIEFVVAGLLGQDVDAIVNPANERLAHGGGVAGAIARAAGPALMDESRRLGGCPTGGAVVTGAGDLPQRWVIHAVGPVWSGGGQGEEEALRACHRALVARAGELGISSIALPAISTGIFGFPPERAAPVAVRAIARSLPAAPTLRTVRFCFVDHALCAIYATAAEKLSAG